ncbi:MAG: DUF721 domain-containing protein [Candidatus Babeliales bacterium]
MWYTLPSLLAHLIPAEHRWKIELLKQWDSIIGPLKEKVIIDKIQDNVLILGVVHPAWAQELLMFMPLLKQKINACCDKERITVIRFRFIDKATLHSKIAGIQTKKRKTTAPPFKHGTLNNAETKALAGIKNPNLREALEHFLYASRQRNPKKE